MYTVEMVMYVRIGFLRKCLKSERKKSQSMNVIKGKNCNYFNSIIKGVKWVIKQRKEEKIFIEIKYCKDTISFFHL